MLFVIYINDMPEMVSSMIHLFADDTKIYRRVGKPEEHDALQDDLFTWRNDLTPGSSILTQQSAR